MLTNFNHGSVNKASNIDTQQIINDSANQINSICKRRQIIENLIQD